MPPQITATSKTKGKIIMLSASTRLGKALRKATTLPLSITTGEIAVRGYPFIVKLFSYEYVFELQGKLLDRTTWLSGTETWDGFECRLFWFGPFHFSWSKVK